MSILLTTRYWVALLLMVMVLAALVSPAINVPATVLRGKAKAHQIALSLIAIATGLAGLLVSDAVRCLTWLRQTVPNPVSPLFADQALPLRC